MVKNLSASLADIRNASLILSLGSYPGEGNGNLLQYSCLENPHEQRLVGYSSQGCKEADMTAVT